MHLWGEACVVEMKCFFVLVGWALAVTVQAVYVHQDQSRGHKNIRTVTKKVPLPYPVQVEKKVPVEIKVPVKKPYPVYIYKPYPVHVEKQVPYPIKVPVPQPYTVEKQIPIPVHVPVEKPYPVTVRKPYTVFVEKKVPFTVEKPVPVEVSVPVDKPYPAPTALPNNAASSVLPENQPARFLMVGMQNTALPSLMLGGLNANAMFGGIGGLRLPKAYSFGMGWPYMQSLMGGQTMGTFLRQPYLLMYNNGMGMQNGMYGANAIPGYSLYGANYRALYPYLSPPVPFTGQNNYFGNQAYLTPMMVDYSGKLNAGNLFTGPDKTNLGSEGGISPLEQYSSNLKSPYNYYIGASGLGSNIYPPNMASAFNGQLSGYYKGQNVLQTPMSGSGNYISGGEQGFEFNQGIQGSQNNGNGMASGTMGGRVTSQNRKAWHKENVISDLGHEYDLPEPDLSISERHPRRSSSNYPCGKEPEGGETQLESTEDTTVESDWKPLEIVS